MLEQKKKHSKDASEDINKKLKEIWGTDKITMCLNKDNTAYKFKLNNIETPYLSEGERTSVAFAYFLVYLETLEGNQNNTLIVIDDPISSLDNNISYQITYILYKLFKEKKYKYIISTHSWYFFYLLFRHKHDNHNVFGINNPTKLNETKWYSIFKNDESLTCFQELNTKTLPQYFAEYKHLLNSLLEYSKESNVYNNNILNVRMFSRKVLELFLYYKYANTDINIIKKMLESKSEETKDKIETLYNYFCEYAHSEGHSIESTPDSLKRNVKQLLDLIKDIDPEHYKAFSR